MITRIWHGTTSMQDADQYLDMLLHKGTEEYRQTPGNLSVKVWKSAGKDTCHFWTVTEWDNLEAVKLFAGNDYERARYYPEDKGILLDFEESVLHHNSYDVSKKRINDFISQFNDLFQGGSWQGECFSEKLKNLDAETAFMRPLEDVHSVAEIVWHIIYWHTVLIKHIGGDHDYRKRTVDELNFLTPVQLRIKGWDTLKSELAETQQNLIKLISSQTDDFLNKEYALGHSFGYVLEGIIQHDIYHLGQIGLVKSILKRKLVLQD